MARRPSPRGGRRESSDRPARSTRRGREAAGTDRCRYNGLVGSRHSDWLHQADADLRLSRHARDGAAHDWACFAAQQAAEKALKAVLMSRGEDAWGHTVTALLGVVAAHGAAGEDLVVCAKTLDKHYIPTRYPNGLDAGAPTDFYTRKDSDDAIACAERLIAFARGQVEQPGGR